MQRLNLYTGQGGVTVVTTGIASTTKVLGIFPGATVSVFNQGTVVLASIFGDNGITPKSNPFVSDSTTGLAFFYAANGRYDIQLSGTGFSTFTLADIELIDSTDALASLTVTGNAAVGGNETVGGTLGVTGAVTAGSYTNNLSAFAPTTSAQLASIISDETGSGALVFGTAPTITNVNLVTPTLGVATATTVNKVTLTPPASTATLTIANNKTLTANNSVTLAGTDGKTLTVNNSMTTAGADGETILGLAATQSPTNKTLTGATTGNNVSVLNAQGAVGPLTGNAGDQVIYTFTLPANTIDTTSKGLRIKAACVHTTGTVSTTLKINLNGVNLVTGITGTTATQSSALEAQILRTGTTTGGVFGLAPVAAANNGTMVSFSQAVTGLAWTSSQTVTLTFNVAATDTFTGIMFMVEQIQ